MGSINAAGAAERDAAAFVAWLDAQPQVDRTKKIGTQGYCMGGPLVVRTAATIPNRIGAGASFHGGGLVTATPDSPHLLAPAMRARLYIGVAAIDHNFSPEEKERLVDALEAGGVRYTLETYPDARHGFAVTGHPVYDRAASERHWATLIDFLNDAFKPVNTSARSRR